MSKRSSKPHMDPVVGLRRSACAAASRTYELERIRRMSVEERIDAALSMAKKFSWLKPAEDKG